MTLPGLRANAPDCCDNDEQRASFYQNLFTIERIRREPFEVGIDKNPVDEHEQGGRVRDEMQFFPKAAAKPGSPIGSDENKNHTVKRKGSEAVIERLFR